MKRFITTCMLLAAVICYGLEIHTPTKKEKEIIAAQVWHDVDGFVIVVKSPPPENYFFAFVAEKDDIYPEIVIFKNNINVDKESFSYVLTGGYKRKRNSLEGGISYAPPATRNNNLLQEYGSSDISLAFNKSISASIDFNKPNRHTVTDEYRNTTRQESISIKDKTIDYLRLTAKGISEKTIFQRNNAVAKNPLPFKFEIPDSILAEIKNTSKKLTLFPLYDIIKNGYKFVYQDEVIYYIVQIENKIHIVATHKNVPFLQYGFDKGNLLALFNNESGSTMAYIESEPLQAMAKFSWQNGEEVNVLYKDQLDAENLFEVFHLSGFKKGKEEKDKK